MIFSSSQDGVMPWPSVPALSVFLVLLLAALWWCTRAYTVKHKGLRKRLPLPPGPPGKPVLGHLFDMPGEQG